MGFQPRGRPSVISTRTTHRPKPRSRAAAGCWLSKLKFCLHLHRIVHFRALNVFSIIADRYSSLRRYWLSILLSLRKAFVEATTETVLWFVCLFSFISIVALCEQALNSHYNFATVGPNEYFHISLQILAFVEDCCTVEKRPSGWALRCILFLSSVSAPL